MVSKHNHKQDTHSIGSCVTRICFCYFDFQLISLEGWFFFFLVSEEMDSHIVVDVLFTDFFCFGYKLGQNRCFSWHVVEVFGFLDS